MFQPLNDYILVRPIKASEAKNETGLVGIDQGKAKPVEGVVVSAHRGYPSPFHPGYHVPANVHAGEHVWFGKFAGTEIVVDGEPLKILRESELFGVDPIPAVAEEGAPIA